MTVALAILAGALMHAALWWLMFRHLPEVARRGCARRGK